MKKNLIKNAFIALVSITLFSAIFSSCKKEEPNGNVDKTKLNALIDSVQTLVDAATTVDYPQASIDALKSTLASVKTSRDNATVTQTQIDNLVVSLRAARTTFMAAAYGAIPANALLLGLTFDETVSANQITTAGKGWKADLKAGPSEIFGTNTAMPTFVAGKVGKAAYLSNGSHFEVSNYAASDLRSTRLSIAVWVKPDSTRAGNYIMSYNYWETWKFQLQEQNKPFFTVQTAAGFTDADNQVDFSAPNMTWTHLVVSLDLTAETLTFYVNGASTMVWTKATKPNLTGTMVTFARTVPLMIGAATTYAEANVYWTWDWPRTPAAWDGFVGALDELKVYNIALTDGQVMKLYNDEK